jgi:hypothetical protein
LQYLNISQLANYLAVTKRTVQRKAIRERWPFKEQVGLGGTRRLYRFHNLPNKIKNQITISIIARHNASELLPTVGPIKTSASQLYNECLSQPIDTATLNQFDIKLRILDLSRLFIIVFDQGKIKGLDKFCQQYIDQTLAVDKAIFTVIPSISRITLLRWEKNEPAIQLKSNATTLPVTDVEVDAQMAVIIAEILMVSPTITVKRLQTHLATFYSDRKPPTPLQLAKLIKAHKDTVKAN